MTHLEAKPFFVAGLFLICYALMHMMYVLIVCAVLHLDKY